MQVEVKHRLPCPRITIHHRTIARLGDAFLPRNFLCRQVQAADNVFILGLQGIDCRDVLARYYEDMGGRLGIHITERNCRIRLINNLCRDVTCQYFAKKTILFTHSQFLVNHTASIERMRQGPTIHVFKLASQWDTMGNA